MFRVWEIAPVKVDYDWLEERIKRLAGNTTNTPDASIIIPVNAQGDMEIVFQILSDIACYNGKHKFEIILVVNHFPPEEPPDRVEQYVKLGLKVICKPNVRRAGEAIGFSARMCGIREASAEINISFDADCRILNSTALLDWYVDQLSSGAKLAYVTSGFYDVINRKVAQARLFIHYSGRWFKRTILGIPTTRGGAYAAHHTEILALYDNGWLADEMNVGPAFKALVGGVVFSGSKDHIILTSGRMISGRSWLGLLKHYRYRVLYNLRVLPLQRNAARRTKRENDPERIFKDNRPVV